MFEQEWLDNCLTQVKYVILPICYFFGGVYKSIRFSWDMPMTRTKYVTMLLQRSLHIDSSKYSPQHATQPRYHHLR